MAPDLNSERFLSTLSTETLTDPPTVEEVTNALRDRLRLRLTVRNVVPVQPLSPEAVVQEASPQVVWSSVLDSLSTGLQIGDGSDTEALPKAPIVSSPSVVPAAVPAPQPFVPQPFAPQPFGHPQPLAPPPVSPTPQVQHHTGQIYVPENTDDYASTNGSASASTNGNGDSPRLPTSMPTPRLSTPVVPYLGQPARTAPTQRVVPSLVVANATRTPRPLQRRRHPFRAFLSFLVVASLLGGASFTGWYFLIKNKVTWSQELDPLAAFVEKVAHAEFVDNVSVVALSAPEYEVKLGIDVLSRSYMDPDGSFGTLRAVGLVSGTPSPSEIGRQVAATITAFYSPADRTVYRVDGTTPVFEVSLLRALTVALADQSTGWSSNVDTLSDAQRVGVRASVDFAGANVVLAKFAADPQLRSLWNAETQARSTALGLPADSHPTYLGAVLGSYAFGATTSPAPSPENPLAGITVPPSDAALFDPARGSRAVPVSASVSPSAATSRTLGMQFWYLVLLPALGPTEARAAAMLWAGDAVVTTVSAGRACVNAQVATTSPEAQAALFAPLSLWAQTRPASSAAAVTNQAGNVVAVSVCEPIEVTTQVVSADSDTMLPYTAAATEVQFGDELIRMGLPVAQGAWTCAVLAYRQGVLPAFVRGSNDQAQADVMLNVLSFCRSS
ncbi:unannotated protein [freshwater metagenome]|uniref:Unannotated protein n=1 Tax=freshwater metagenome TaxID=449393 RepID=A0A6J7EEJ9_9ZZZZ|nr:hypothetical protein [Actinomycetota bacterium]